MDKCHRCGQCCHYRNKEGQLVACKFLVKHDKLFSCRIYNNRLGVKIAEGITCVRRELSPYDYPNCPSNTNKKFL